MKVSPDSVRTRPGEEFEYSNPSLRHNPAIRLKMADLGPISQAGKNRTPIVGDQSSASSTSTSGLRNRSQNLASSSVTTGMAASRRRVYSLCGAAKKVSPAPVPPTVPNPIGDAEHDSEIMGNEQIG
jgi:hypothetical protein